MKRIRIIRLLPLVSLVIALFVPSTADIYPSLPTEQQVAAQGADEVVVSSTTSGWQQTSLSVQQGQVFSISYVSGTWTVDYHQFPYVGPEGYPPEIDQLIFQGCKLDPSLPYGRLLGRIDDEAFFSVGQGGSFTASISGELSLKIHDNDGCLADNLGAITVAVETQNLITITTASPLPSGTVGQPYSTTLEATGGTEPYTWSVDSGNLPSGLSLNAQTGEISGTPTAAGTFGFTIRVTDSSQITTTKQFALSPPPSGGEVGTDYPPTPIVIAPPSDDGGDGGTAPVCSNYVLAPGSDPLPPGMSLDPLTGILSGTPENGGTYTFIVQCTFNTNQTATKDFTITINNPVPSLTALDPDSVIEDSGGFTVALTGTGLVHDSVAHLNGSPRPTSYISATELQVSIDASDIEDPGTASLTVFNPAPGGGESNALTLTIEPKNQPPTVDSGGPYTVDEGGAVTLTAVGSDPDVGETLTYAWDLDGDGTFETLGQSATFSAAGVDGPTALVVACQVTDSGGLTAIDSATVAITNVAPSVGPITAPIDPVLVSTQISASASFTDPGLLDTHTAVWDWGDGTSSAGVVTETDGSGTARGDHSYTVPGIYTIRLTVTDDDGDSGQATFEYVVVYDPDGGFVTGGGWIDSPAGAYVVDPSLTGKANFGFVSKYKKGATVPTGSTEFQFKAGEVNFHSDSYDWLVVNQGGANAQFKGSGTINGAMAPTGELYRFMIWAGDDSDDTFRIRIWYEDGGVEIDVYDNGFDQPISGGSIVIHAK